MDRNTADILIGMAAEARKNARVPLSGFHVGAALLMRSGEIITGCNAEQSNMYESICAERCAITKAVSSGYRDFAAVAVVSDAEYPLAPCGLCRQAIIDYGPDIEVIMSNPDKSKVLIMTAAELLPAYDLDGSPLCSPFEELFEKKGVQDGTI